jgi:hypothetical protein
MKLNQFVNSFLYLLDFRFVFSTINKMPPKKAINKRKIDSSPIQSDPFTAAKKNKKNDNEVQDLKKNPTIQKKQEELKDIPKESSDTKYNREKYKTTTNEIEWNYKILSWNVAGIRSWLEVFH